MLNLRFVGSGRVFQNGLDTDDPNAIAAAAAPLGIDRDMILAGIADPEVKIIARQQGEQAVARGGFGSPWIFVDGEPFWGSDRLPRVGPTGHVVATDILCSRLLRLGLDRQGVCRSRAWPRPRRQ